MPVVKEATLTVEKKHPYLILSYLCSISLQSRTKLKRSLIIKQFDNKTLDNNKTLNNETLDNKTISLSVDVILWALITEISFVNKFLINWLKNTLFYRVWYGDCFDIFCVIQICFFQCIFFGFLPKASKVWYYSFSTSITADQHLRFMDPNLFYILLIAIITEQKQVANYDNCY